MADVTNDPWDGSSSRYTIEQWRRACLIDHGGDRETKSNFSLPVREPTGELNRNGLAAAAGRLNQVQGITADQRAAAARALIRLYDELGETAPDHLHQLAGRSDDRGSGRAGRVDDDSVEALTGAPVERFYSPGMVEVRSNPAGARTVYGYGAIFGSLSQRLGFGGREQVGRNFFDDSQAEGWPWVVCRWDHDPKLLLGSTSARTLRLLIDGTGLRYDVDLPATRADLAELIERRDVAHSSFSFVATQDDWEYRSGEPIRTLLRGKLIDVAPVSTPAYTSTSAAIRSLARHVDGSYEEIARLVQRDEVRRLFTRPDRRPTGAQAYAAVGQRRRLTGAQAYAAVQSKLDTLRGAEALARLTPPRLRGRDALELHARKGK